MTGFVFFVILLQQPVSDGFRYEEASILFASDRVTFTAVATSQADLNHEVTAELWDQSGRLTATGSAHRFSHIGERFHFEIDCPAASLQVGSTVGLNLTSVPGSRGSFKQTTVQVGVPALGGMGLFALIILLTGLGLIQQRC